MRLTQKLKAGIIENISKMAFLKEREAIESRTRDLSTALYRTIVSPQEESNARKAGARFVSMTQKQGFHVFRTMDDLKGFENSIFINGTFISPVPIPVSLDAVFSASVADSRLFLSAQLLDMDSKQVNLRLSSLKESVSHVMNEVTTVEQLLERLPAILPFIPTQKTAVKKAGQGQVQLEDLSRSLIEAAAR